MKFPLPTDFSPNNGFHEDKNKKAAFTWTAFLKANINESHRPTILKLLDILRDHLDSCHCSFCQEWNKLGNQNGLVKCPRCKGPQSRTNVNIKCVHDQCVKALAIKILRAAKNVAENPQAVLKQKVLVHLKLNHGPACPDEKDPCNRNLSTYLCREQREFYKRLNFETRTFLQKLQDGDWSGEPSNTLRNRRTHRPALLRQLFHTKEEMEAAAAERRNRKKVSHLVLETTSTMNFRYFECFLT
jgi:hypothetical protein